MKPAAQSVGVRGIDATKFREDEVIPKRLCDRLRIAGLPPFQMFAAEKHQLPAALVLQDDAVNEYIQWHQAKGYWPGETPFGELS